MIRNQIIKAIQRVVGIEDVRLEVPENEGFGDYSSNIAMQMFSRAGEQESRRAGTKNPKQLAEKIVQKLSKDEALSKIVSKTEVKKPGFINFWLEKEHLVDQVNQVNRRGEKFGASNLEKGKTVVVDYSAPNIAKKFSVGHLRSTIIGQALYNLYKNLGYKVIGDNHLGDWGTQFGIIIAQVIRKKVDVSKLSIDEIEHLYVEFNKEAKDNPELKKQGSLWFKKLEEGDKRARKIWQDCIDISMKEFEKIWKMLDVSIDYAYGESFYEDKMQAVIDEFRKKKVSKKSEGAEIIEFPSTSSGSAMAPAILLKSDGGTTYFTRDLATIKYRLDTWKPSLIIYEVGAEQKLHFKQVFAAARLVGWDSNIQYVHVPHGLFLLEGKKMSTRKGTTIKLEEVLDGATEKAYKLVEDSETGGELTKEEKEEIAKMVGIGAVKYFDLMHHPTSEINFSWKTIFNMQGNSGPYLQYTFARTQSVLRKIPKFQNSKTPNNWKMTDGKWKINTEELALLRSFIHFPEVVEAAAENFAPNLICNYLYDLAQKFNGFYNSCRILEPKVKGKRQEVKEFRLGLTKATGQILKNGLNLLGIEAPQKM